MNVELSIEELDALRRVQVVQNVLIRENKRFQADVEFVTELLYELCRTIKAVDANIPVPELMRAREEIVDKLRARFS